MTTTIKLSTGKELELTQQELFELYNSYFLKSSPFLKEKVSDPLTVPPLFWWDQPYQHGMGYRVEERNTTRPYNV